MPKLTTTRHDLLQDRPGETLGGNPNNRQQPCDAVLDVFICEARPPVTADADTPAEQIPLAEVVREFEAQPPIDEFFSSKHLHGTKLSRAAAGMVADLGMEHHPGKQISTKSSLWAFEHRWPHLRDRAEGRNHRLPSN